MGTSLWLGLAGLGSLATTSVTSAVEAAVAGTAAPSELLLNRDTGGRVLDRAPPTFTWRPPSDLRCGSKQTAYQLRLVDAAGAMVVDTGRVPSAASTNVALPRAAGELRAGRHYSWSVKVWATEHDQPNPGMATSGELCESESAWSPPSAFRTAIWDGFAATTQAVWTPGKARYALFRQEIAVPEGAKNATCYVTALVGGAKQKLLGAYRLYVNGASAGIGPGRGDCSLEYKGSAADKQLCTEHDTIDLSDHLPAAGGKLTIGLQSYHEGGSGAVKLQLHFETDTAEVVQVGTNSSWLSHDATAYFNPFSATGGYNAPRENQNASAYAGAWQHSDYHPPTGVAWSPSVVQDDFPATAVAKTGLPLSITTGVVPPVLIRVEQSSDDALFFFDQTSEVMGGVHLEVPVGASGGYKYAEVTLSEELDGLYGSGALLYPMRTGNRYRYLFSLDPSIRSVFDIHEYALYRYGTLRFCNAVVTSKDEARCASSRGPPAGPPPPPPPTVARGCVSAAEHEKVTLECSKDTDVIANITFASFGTPTGECFTDGRPNTFKRSANCDANNSQTVFETLCVGKKKCSFTVDMGMFKGCSHCLPDGDPCHNVVKRLELAVGCASSPRRSAVAAPSARAVPTFELSSWNVHYPWSESDFGFSSSDSMLTRVYGLCANTLRVTSLDTTTDSNTRERLPYEADGFITGNSRYMLQREYNWQLHSGRHQFLNPTWPTEWHQFMAMAAYEYYMQTGDTQLASSFWDLLVLATYSHCADKSVSASGLVDFTHCSRDSSFWPTTRDNIDWPMNSRDGYVNTNRSTEVNAFMVYSSRKLAQLGRAIGTTKTVADAERLEAQANITAQAMRNLLVDSETGLFHDGLDGGAENHSAWHSQTSTLWLGVAQSATKPRMLEFLARKRMVGSVYAAYSYLLGLYEVDEDHGKVALEMMTDCDENSWCHMLTVNATSTMEAWSRAEKPNLSWSHPWATAAVTAIVRGFIGLTAVKPAFSSWQLKPQPGNATWAAIRVPSVAGLFDVSFNQTASSFGVAITPPANTIGSVCLPKLGSSSPTLQVGTHTVPGTIQGDYVCASGLAPAKGQSVLHVTRTSAM